MEYESMEWEVHPTQRFKKEFKALYKRYRSLREDFDEFVKELKTNPFRGTDIGAGIRKIRIAVSSKGKGKSGGARVITLTACTDEKGDIFLLSIYDKSEQASISKKEIEAILREEGLL